MRAAQVQARDNVGKTKMEAIMEPKEPIIKDVNLESPDEDAPTMVEKRAHVEDLAASESKGE